MPMKRRLLIYCVFGGLTAYGNCQGQFLFYNGNARTRIGAADGPLAGQGYWAQMLAGDTTTSLIPVGMSLEHTTNGAVGGIVRIIDPNIPPHSFAFVQMVAWNGNLWGPNLNGVPVDQLGRTDIVPVFLTTGIFPEGAFSPSFTQPAIVPIPEPSAWALVAIGAAGFCCARRRRK